MANEVVVKEREAVFSVSGEEVRLSPNTVKNFLTRGNEEVTDQEVVMFINLCKYQKLNPFLNEVYLVKFKGAPAQIIVSKEAYMKRAESNPNYQGFDAGIIVERDGELVDLEGAVKLSTDKLVGGWARVYRKDRKQPISVRISLEEFSKGQATWKQMPLNMIRKSAIVNAQREAFPESLGALYTEEEAIIPDGATVDVQVKQEILENANRKSITFNSTQAIDANVRKESVNTEIVQGASSEDVMQGQTTFAGPGF